MQINILALLDELNRLDESTRIEAKAASDVGKSAMETVVAFANTEGLGGGYLLLGVGKGAPSLFGGQYAPTGLRDPDRVMSDLASQCASMLSVPVRPSVERATIDGQVVVAAFIPEAEPDQKPIFISAQGLPRGARVRVGATDQRCSDSDVARMYQARSVRPFDDTLVLETTFADRSVEALDRYRRERRFRDPDAPELAWDDERLLRGLKLVREDARGVLRLSVAGVLLFGRPEVVRDFFPSARVDYVRVQGRVWAPESDDRFTTLDRLGPLFETVYAMETAILDDLPVAFSLPGDSLHRVDKPLLPRAVIREALVNALMHRDYQAGSPTQIIRYSDRIEFRNKGYSLKPDEQLGEPGSELRNRRIADVLHQTRLAETKGTGIAAMRHAMVAADLTPPFFESNREQNRFVATLRLHHFATPATMAWLARFDALTLSREDKQAFLFVREVGQITNEDYRNLNATDTLTASQALRRLRDLGLLLQHDRGAQTFYTLADSALDAGDLPEAPARQEAAYGEPEVAQTRPEVAQAGRKVSQPSYSRAAPDAWDSLPPDLQHAVSQAGLRSTHTAMRAVLLALCMYQPWTSESLASLMGRHRKTLVDRHLSPMVRAGTLIQIRSKPPRYEAAESLSSQIDTAL